MPRKSSNLEWSPREGLETLTGVERDTVMRPGFARGGRGSSPWRIKSHFEDGKAAGGLGRVDDVSHNRHNVIEFRAGVTLNPF